MQLPCPAFLSESWYVPSMRHVAWNFLSSPAGLELTVLFSQTSGMLEVLVLHAMLCALLIHSLLLDLLANWGSTLLSQSEKFEPQECLHWLAEPS